ncbi:hypothetical protein [Psychrobacter sp. I-STPA10]|uniref:hypothetical protein n=1 Tax=Psychrobacter sp. I-STPA10 TaxID=2585769 RepID=UPI001E40F451|nr:hypothetical protein [Psychrobacter sp. I-STPA10]
MNMKQSHHSNKHHINDNCLRGSSRVAHNTKAADQKHHNKKDSSVDYKHYHQHQRNHNTQPSTVPQRLFMDTLLKHTAIALAIIIPLAAYSAFATSSTLNAASNATAATNPFLPLATIDNDEVHSQHRMDVQSNADINDVNKDTQYMHTLGVPAYDDQIMIPNHTLAADQLYSSKPKNTQGDTPINVRN